jgi:hypothetical protein
MLKELTSDDVMDIAERAEIADAAERNRSDSDDFPSVATPEYRALGQRLEALSRPALNELVALMWIGRGDYEPSDWKYLVRRAGGDQGDLVGYVIEKAPLAEYLREGLAALRSPTPRKVEADADQDAEDEP